MLLENQLDAAFKALGDKTRRGIIETLFIDGQQPASKFVKKFNSSQPNISKHLRVLEQASLIKRTINGRQHWFSIEKSTFDIIEKWVDRHSRFWSGNLNRLDSYLDNQTDERDD